MTAPDRRQSAAYRFRERAGRSFDMVRGVSNAIREWDRTGQVPTGRKAGSFRRNLTNARKELEAAAADLDEWLTPD